MCWKVFFFFDAWFKKKNLTVFTSHLKTQKISRNFHLVALCSSRPSLLKADTLVSPSPFSYTPPLPSSHPSRFTLYTSMCCVAFCVTASLCLLCLRLLQAPGVHPPAVADGVEEAAAAGGAGVAAGHLGRAVLHQAAAAARRVHRVGLVTLVNSSNMSFNKQVRMIFPVRFPVPPHTDQTCAASISLLAVNS